MSGWFGFLRTRLVVIGVVGLCALGVVCWWPTHSDGGWDAYAHAIGAAHARQMAADAQALREARAAVVHDSVTVTRAVATYHVIRDTTRLTDTVWVKQLIASSDSVVRSCTALLSSCALYHVRAESVIAGLTTENDALAAEVKAIHGSRIVKAWSRVRVPLAFVAGAYIGSRVTR